MRVALVQDWLTGMRGGEWVLHEIAALFPEAPIYTMVHVPGSVTPEIERHPIRTSFVQRLPAGSRQYRRYLPLLPLAAERLDLGGYDFVLSTSHCVAKGVRPAPGAVHVSYLHTPMRYVWHLYQDYARGLSLPGRAALALAAPWLRRWDVASASRVTHFLANSRTVAARIHDTYRRDAEVIHPPVDTAFFHPETGRSRRDYYLAVTALVPYKRVELALGAIGLLGGRRLLVVGSGPEEARLRRLAPSGVEFLGWQPRERVRELYRGARALLFPALEDFGMAPVEALACGTPVVAYGRGGVTESVRGVVAGPAGAGPEILGPGEAATGVFFHPQTAEAMAAAIEAFESSRFDAAVLRAAALPFDRQCFRRALARALTRAGGPALASMDTDGSEGSCEPGTASCNA